MQSIGGGVGKLDNRRDLRVEMTIEFGGKVGMERLLELLERENALCSSACKWARRRGLPQTSMCEYHRRGHEITGHSYAEDISSYDFNDDPELERNNIRKTVNAIER